MDRKQKIVIGVMAAVLVAVLAAVALSVLPGLSASPSFVPPPRESGAVVGTPAPEEAADHRVFQVADAFSVGLSGAPAMGENGELLIWFENPPFNTVMLRLRLYNAAGELIGESGLIAPGEYLPALIPTIPVSRGESLSARILSYEPSTYLSHGSASAEIAVRLAE